MEKAANNLGISLSSIHRWIKEYSSNNDDEEVRCLEVLVIIPVMMQKNWQD